VSLPPNDEPPGPEHLHGAPAPARSPRLLYAAIGGVAALVVTAGVLVVSSRGGDEDASGGQLGDAVGAVPTTTLPSNVGTVATTTTAPASPSEGDGDGGAPVTIPGEVSPPTTAPGTEPASVPSASGDAPLFGQIIVDPSLGAMQDFSVHLRTDQEVQLLSLGDDGIETQIEVFAPDGSSEGLWQGGEPGVVNGLEWYHPDEPLPATGTYVIRVVHTGGRPDRFVLGFFGTA